MSRPKFAPPKFTKAQLKYFRECGRIGGLKGAGVVMETMTAEQRRARASKAGKAGAKVRWGNRKP